MFYREDKNFISEEQGRFLDDFIYNKSELGDFPWYYSPGTGPKYNAPFLFHAIKKRPEYRQEDEEEFNSPIGPFFMELLTQFAERNNIKYDVVYRCCINLSFSLKVKPQKHTDHEFPYKHLLIYLNDSDGDTCIFNEKGTKIEKRITPEKHKGVCFEKKLHYAEFPTNGSRFVVAYTFN